VVKVSIFFLELTDLIFVFVFEVFADLAAFFSFFKEVSEGTGLLKKLILVY